MLGRIIGIIVTTFIIAMLYGFFVTTMDFLGTGYDPVASGHRAAHNVYGLFGVVSEEIENNSTHPTSKLETVMRKIAAPYAVTADLTAILTGKLEIGIASFFHAAETKADQAAPVRE